MARKSSRTPATDRLLKRDVRKSRQARAARHHMRPAWSRWRIVACCSNLTPHLAGQEALKDAVDGNVRIADREYPVPPAVVDALRFPAYFNAGAVGPDGFPDIVIGQGVIHPQDTGLWLRDVYERLGAQTDCSSR